MSELLKRLGIVPGPGFQFGRNHATACPKCQHLRRRLELLGQLVGGRFSEITAIYVDSLDWSD